MTGREIIDRLEKLTAPSREVDRLIYEALRPTSDPEEHRKIYDVDPAAYWYWVSHRDYTKSLDEAIALVVKVMPGYWSFALRNAMSALPSDDPSALPRFVLIALLKAMEAGQ